MNGLLLLFALIAVFFAWYYGAKAKENATRHVGEALRNAGMQLLDGTIYLRKIWPARLQSGRVGILRFFHFEYTANGADRYRGLIVMAADKMEYLQIEKDGHTVVTTSEAD